MPIIDSRKRQVVADIIRRLHQGLAIEDARRLILSEVGRLTSAEITSIEQSLIDEGMPPDEIRRFCNVHALLFEPALEKSMESADAPGHPLALLAAENRSIAGVVAQLRSPSVRADPAAFRRGLERLAGVRRHYELKENALFPALERHGFPGPSKVMWSKHDEVRALLAAVDSPQGADTLLDGVESMIFKEENILFPAARERIPPAEWVQILKAFDEIGLAFVPGAGLHAALEETERQEATHRRADEVDMPSGMLSIAQLTAMLDTLPFDITFVDAHDRVRYFSQSRDRIFVRATTVLGRDVHDCHPPQSVQKVKRIIEDFRAGRRDVAEFRIELRGRYVHIRYFAVRDRAGAYLGTVEVTQDITEIRTLQGEKRLLDEGS